MRIYTTYKVKIKHYNHIFKDTVKIYRDAVGYLINVCLENWDSISMYKGQNRLTYIEALIHSTKENPVPKYDFDVKFGSITNSM